MIHYSINFVFAFSEDIVITPVRLSIRMMPIPCEVTTEAMMGIMWLGLTSLARFIVFSFRVLEIFTSLAEPSRIYLMGNTK